MFHNTNFCSFVIYDVFFYMYAIYRILNSLLRKGIHAQILYNYISQLYDVFNLN